MLLSVKICDDQEALVWHCKVAAWPLRCLVTGTEITWWNRRNVRLWHSHSSRQQLSVCWHCTVCKKDTVYHPLNYYCFSMLPNLCIILRWAHVRSSSYNEVLYFL